MGVWMMEIASLPPKVIAQSRVVLPPRDGVILQRRSVSMFAVGEGRKLVFVLGLLPPTPLSLTVGIWMLVLRGTWWSKRLIRTLRTTFPAFLRCLPYRKYVADVQCPRDARFASFLGGTRVDENTYMWETSL